MVVTQVEEFVFVEVGGLRQQRTVPPLLGIPLVWGALDCFVGWLRSVKCFFPLFVVYEFAVNRLEGVVEGIL